MLERRGLKDREWAVEWEASAQDFLLEKGFSPEMGARPLKRAIDQYVIAPLAATIVEQRFPEGDQFVFVRSDGRAIQAEFVDPDGDAPATREPAHGAAGKPPALPEMILAPEGTAAEVAGSRRRACRHRGGAGSPRSWEDLKARPLAGSMAAAGFLDAARPPRHPGAARADGSREGGDEHRRGPAGAARQGHGADRAAPRASWWRGSPCSCTSSRKASATCSRRRPSRSRCRSSRRWRSAGDRQATRAWCAQRAGHVPRLGRATGTCNSRRSAATSAAQPAAGSLISGFGAHRLLVAGGRPACAGAPMRRRAQPGHGARPARRGAARRSARATSCAAPSRTRFSRGPQPHAVVRRYRSDPSPLVRNMNGSWRTGRLDAVLRGDFDLIAASQA